MRRLPLSLLGASMLTLALLSAGCERRPKGVISEKKMVEVMTDMKLAESYAANFNTVESDSLPRRLADAVLLKHGVSRADFDSTLVWYGRNFDRYVALYDKVEKRMESRQKDFLDGAVAVAASGEADIWPYGANIMLTRKGATDGLNFSLSSPDVKPGEEITWKLRMNSDADAKLVLGVDYTDGTTKFVTRRTQGSRKLEITIPVDSLMQLKRVYGTFHLAPHHMPLWLDSISLTHLPAGSSGGASSYPVVYRLPEKFDPAKAKAKARADSLKTKALSDSLAKIDPQVAGAAKADQSASKTPQRRSLNSQETFSGAPMNPAVNNSAARRNSGR